MDTRTTRSGQRAGAAYVPVTRGAHRHRGARAPELATLRAWASVLPSDACFTHVTAARLLGLWLPPLPADLVTLAALPPGAHPVRRRGLRASRSLPSEAHRMVQGLRVAPTADVLLCLCRDLADLDALMAVDSALHQELVTVDLLLRSDEMLADVDRSLGRASDRRRLSSWHELLRTSALTSAGRDVLWPRLQK
ncbi:hypothetical protein [Nocardioides jishulii]|uniref:AbiEi antitoxin C-terminal domain-containing protein n=1 Tax=Nocardioides jishulii TaxID=2575440 RepID=A0A4U2YR42_9ACTN|nr:hypothetical protein [Nocardioides jishulii]QCX26318.1 hypothetical protein FCL41_01245 [Nocardioides jishulii]TKI63877.1 hypothetical protein FC770_01460 [Nocardioides jishulii]